MCGKWHLPAPRASSLRAGPQAQAHLRFPARTLLKIKAVKRASGCARLRYARARRGNNTPRAAKSSRDAGNGIPESRDQSSEFSKSYSKLLSQCMYDRYDKPVCQDPTVFSRTGFAPSGPNSWSCTKYDRTPDAWRMHRTRQD